MWSTFGTPRVQQFHAGIRLFGVVSAFLRRSSGTVSAGCLSSHCAQLLILRLRIARLQIEFERKLEMLQHDLKSAGIPYVDPDGRYADFHALRHTFITNLMKSGVNPKTAQSLARHSTIELTMNVYTSLTVHDQAAALASLPAPPILVAEAAFKATGTDGPKMVPTMVPRSAKNGAERLASAPQDLAPDCTQNGRRQRPRRSSQSSSKRGKKAHSRSSTQQSASSCEAERARFELAAPVRALRFSRPEQDSRKGKTGQEIQKEAPAEVPAMVPSFESVDDRAIDSAELTRILNEVPDEVRVAILGVVRLARAACTATSHPQD